MTLDNSRIESATLALRAAIDGAGRGLIERRALLETIALAAVAGEHLLVIGPPGTAKSEAVRRMAQAVGGTYFEYLLGRFTEPSELFGPIDLRKLREGTVETETGGMLPEAEIAFLDEIFQGSTAILNTLLGLLNERVFRRGHTQMRCPLRLCVAASNALPEDESLNAFADRFLLRVFVDSIADPRLEELLEGGWALGANGGASNGASSDGSPVSVIASLNDIDTLAEASRATDMTGVRPQLAHAIRLLRGAGVNLSDRRLVKVQRLIAAAALLDGRLVPDESDLWPLIQAVPTREEQAIARDVLRDLLGSTHNSTLPDAAELASQGPLMRAGRLVKDARAVLDAPPPDGDVTAAEIWRLKLEGIAREIDAGFASEQRPLELAAAREQIVTALKPYSDDTIS